jgi:hypothetical protein
MNTRPDLSHCDRVYIRCAGTSYFVTLTQPGRNFLASVTP